MRLTTWMMAAALALSGCAVKSSLTGLTGKKNQSARPDAPPTEETEAMKRDRESRERERADYYAQQEREKEERGEASRKGFRDMVVVEPANGMPKVGAIDIDWCDLVPESQSSGGALYRSMYNAEERGWYMESLVDVATLLCINPTDPQYREQAGYFLQAWVNMSGLQPKQMLAHIKLRLKAEAWENQHQAYCKNLSVSDEASDTDKVMNNALRTVFGCKNPPIWFGGQPDMFKMDQFLHEIDRSADTPPQELLVYRVLGCIDPNAEDITPQHLVHYAACRQDALSLSSKKLEAELKKGSYNDYARTVMRENLAFTQLHVKRYEAAAKAIAAKDEAWKTLIFAVPEQAQKAWNKKWKRNAAALDAAAAYEVTYYGPSRKAARGCGDDLRQHMRSYLRKSKPKNADAAKAALTDEVGSQILTRLAACEYVEGNALPARHHAELAKNARASRGWRVAVYYALAEALGEIKSDRERFPVSPSDLGQSPTSPMAYDVSMQVINMATGEDKGVVKSVKAKDGGVVLTFKKERWKEPAVICEDTKKIWRIDENGQVLYFKKCRDNGYETMEHTAKTIWVPDEYAGGIKPGSFVRFDYVYGGGDALKGMVREVYASKKQKKLVNFYGFEL